MKELTDKEKLIEYRAAIYEMGEALTTEQMSLLSERTRGTAAHVMERNPFTRYLEATIVTGPSLDEDQSWELENCMRALRTMMGDRECVKEFCAAAERHMKKNPCAFNPFGENW